MLRKIAFRRNRFVFLCAVLCAGVLSVRASAVGPQDTVTTAEPIDIKGDATLPDLEASEIVRDGLVIQGKGASLKQMIGWVFRG